MPLSLVRILNYRSQQIHDKYVCFDFIDYYTYMIGKFMKPGKYLVNKLP